MGLSPSNELAKSLAKFLSDFSEVSINAAPRVKEKFVAPKSSALAEFVGSIAQPLENARASAWNFDPWEVAGLKRDEMRNSAVLAWLLNPKGSHGLQDALMCSLLGYLRNSFNSLPASIVGYCSVRTERCPNGDSSERVDIEIDAASCYVLIEVKIDAPEGVDQLSRYCELAKSVASGRPWLIIYLTPGKAVAKTGGDFSENIVEMSWKEMAEVIEEGLPQVPASPAKSWFAANHAVLSFVRNIRNY